MINFSENFYGLPLTTWLIILAIILVILYFYLFQNKSRTGESFQDSSPAPVATIYNFNTTWCGWSVKFQPEWDNFAEKVQADPRLKNISVVDVKCDKSENEGKCKEFEVEGFPTVIIEMGDKVGTYKGPRTTKDLLETINNL
jgi:hypothetical protein